MRYILLPLLLAGALRAQVSFNAHEWGTFTTVSGSDGSPLSGIYREEEQLPDFVYHFPGFSPDSSVKSSGYKPCRNVTVKMETPVLYFYSPTQLDVRVHVDFPHGAITQWYPDRFDGEQMPTEDTLRFDNTDRKGSIDW